MILADQLDIIRQHQNSAPVQVVPLAVELGLPVYRDDDLPDDLSGMIVRDAQLAEESGYAIIVNGRHAETRRRFTIAHEIAHFLLHRDLIGDGISDDALYRSGLSNAVEAQANRMAANILMPWHLINEAINAGIKSVPALATKFHVSNSAMSIRLGVPYETTASSSRAA